MKREILFKAKRVDNGQWIEGDLVHEAFDGTSSLIPIGIRYKLNGSFCYPQEVHPDTVCQFTGLLDKNGNKIFEGDITDEGIIVFHEEYLGFFVKETDDDYNPLYDKVFVEITGNIHD